MEENKYKADSQRDIEGLFVTIPISILTDKKLTASDKIVFGVIAMSCQSTGWGHRTNKTIAKLTGYSIKSVERSFQVLNKRDYIHSEWDGEKQQRFYEVIVKVGNRVPGKKK